MNHRLFQQHNTGLLNQNKDLSKAKAIYCPFCISQLSLNQSPQPHPSCYAKESRHLQPKSPVAQMWVFLGGPNTLGAVSSCIVCFQAEVALRIYFKKTDKLLVEDPCSKPINIAFVEIIIKMLLNVITHSKRPESTQLM